MYAVWSVASEVKLAVDLAAIAHFGSTDGAEAYATIFCLLDDVEVLDVRVAGGLLWFVCHGLYFPKNVLVKGLTLEMFGLVVAAMPVCTGVFVKFLIAGYPL